MNDSSDSRISSYEARRRAVDLVRRAFERAGWDVVAEPSSEEARRSDLVVRNGGVHYAAEVKAIPRGSSVPLEDAWSRACADIIQVWLDVADHASRGAEQSQKIWNRYIQPLVEESRA